ncbi:peptidase, partial [Stenotrophomonas maltophilia]
MTTLLSEMRGRLIAASEQSPERRREAADTLFGIENSYKVYWGQARALDDAGFAGKLAANEADLKAKAGKQLGDPWGDIA